MEIRNPDKTHLSAVFALLERCFPGAWSAAEVSDRIFYDQRYDPNHVWMAREQGQVLGLIVSVQDGPDAWLKLLAVDESARGKGIGSDLLSRAEFRLSGEGVRSLNIAPSPPREFLPAVTPASQAEAFFVRRGFSPSGSFELRWTQAQTAPSGPGPEVDRPTAAAFGRHHGGTAWPWIEEQLSWHPARAAFDPEMGLCLAQPGLSVGPLWPAPTATPAGLAALVGSALAIASSAPPMRSEGLRVWTVEGSLDLPGLSTLSSTVNTYTKDLS